MFLSQEEVFLLPWLLQLRTGSHRNFTPLTTTQPTTNYHDFYIPTMISFVAIIHNDFLSDLCYPYYFVPAQTLECCRFFSFQVAALITCAMGQCCACFSCGCFYSASSTRDLTPGAQMPPSTVVPLLKAPPPAPPKPPPPTYIIPADLWTGKGGNPRPLD